MKHIALFSLVVFTLALLGACAAPLTLPTAQPPTADSTAVPAVTVAAQAQPSLAPKDVAPTTPSATGGDLPRAVKHLLGETTITGDAERIVALEWTYVEDILALGVQPVGIADVEGYKAWVKTPGVELSPDVVDLGFRGEPNLESLLSLDPDLIIEIDFSAAGYYDKLAAIAPTLVFSPYPEDTSLSTYQEMRDTFLTIADATGKRAQGEAALKRLDDKIAASKAHIEASGKSGSKIILSQAWGAGGDVGIRLFTDNGMAVEVVKRLGLENGWQYPKVQQYGFSTVTPEALSSIGKDVHFFYVVQNDDDPFTSTALKPLWDSLAFVQAGNAHPLGGDTWLFGGPLSMELLVDIVTETLTGSTASAAGVSSTIAFENTFHPGTSAVPSAMFVPYLTERQAQ